MPYGPHPKPIEVRFWPKVRKTKGCWEWTGCLDRKGYGKIGVGSLRDGTRGTAEAHRVSYELAFGPIPRRSHVLHHCDNPRCVRPDHLFLGTAADNLHDSVTKDRFPAGDNAYNARLSRVQVIVARAAYTSRKVSADIIAKAFDVSPSIIRRVVRGLSYIRHGDTLRIMKTTTRRRSAPR